MLVKYNEFSISTNDSNTNDFKESIFFQGNGYMGVRGFACEDESIRPYQKGLYMAGVFDQLKPGITDIVNTPSFMPFTAIINGQSLNRAIIKDFCETLDFSDGVLTREYVAEFNGKNLRVKLSRFLSLYDVHTAAIRLELIPLDFKGEIRIVSSIDTTSCNLPIQDDQLKKNIETVKYLVTKDVKAFKNGGFILAKTMATDIHILQAFGMLLSDNIDIKSCKVHHTEERLDYTAEFYAKQGESYIIDKLVTVYTSRDTNKETLESTVSEALRINLKKGYTQLLADNTNEWRKRWETADIKISGDIKSQCAIRHTLYQLIANNARLDSHASIGARGLTHARYKGCYFWDTEIFMLPFFIYSDPIAAKNLLLYRYNTLGAARNHSSGMSTKGARFPWMTSFDGSEQCETWDIGACEVHVTCDIAYAFQQYIDMTGDTGFLSEAAEVYIETARFWESRFTYNSKQDRYNMLFVKGPDEYCGSTQNNTFTNYLAIYNLKLALSSLEYLKNNNEKVYKLLVSKLELENPELSKWADIIKKTPLLYDNERNLYLQDETFMLLEPIDISAHKTDNTPLYHKIAFDRLQRYQVIKQADLVLLMTLFPHDFTLEHKEAVWNFYEPKTLHDSTLSYGIHATLAAQLKDNIKAWDYLNKSLFLDLENIMNNTGSEGLHLAALGATWQALVFGFAGLTFENNLPVLKPNLPIDWDEMSFTLFHKGRKLQITANRNGGTAKYLD